MRKLLAFVFVLTVLKISVYAQTINVVTEYFPPFQWEKNGKITGPSTEVIQAVIKGVGVDSSIKIYPWARAYTMALKDKNVLIYSIAKIKGRENKFKWVGSIMSRNSYLWKLKKRKDVQVETLEDAKNYKTAGMSMDSGAEYLFSKGFIKDEDVYMVSNNEAAIKLLFAQRIDLIVDNNGLQAKVEKYGYDFDLLEKVLPIEELSGEIYAAFSLLTEDEVVDKFRNELKKLKQNGEFSKIISKYE